MPTVSIVIPVYNSEKFLKQCLNSLLLQTFSDMEIICVNDGSSDNFLQILDAGFRRIVKLSWKRNMNIWKSIAVPLEKKEKYR